MISLELRTLFMFGNQLRVPVTPSQAGEGIRMERRHKGKKVEPVNGEQGEKRDFHEEEF